ncbi:MAG: PqqD family protein [Bacteroidetes bacterium]|nr:PqqD family protein [Bacteroidota bacterium]
MNYWKRKQILSKTNALDLIPVPNRPFEVGDDGRVTLLITRFDSKWWGPLQKTGVNKIPIRINLDETGSITWLALQHQKPIRDICSDLFTSNPDKFRDEQDASARIIKFIQGLYHQRFISFRQLIDH